MFVLLITLACTAAGPEAPAAVTALTKADIPADLSPELKRAIEKTLSDDNSECVKAMRKLRKLRGGAAPAVPFLIELCLNRPVIGTEACVTLREIGDSAVEPCLAAMNRTSGEKRLNLIRALGRFTNPRILDAVTALLDDPDPQVRHAATCSLLTCRDPRVVLPLLRAFKDKDTKVRKDAIWHFANCPDPQALGPLLDALKDTDTGVRDNAVRAVQSYTDDRVTPALIEVLRNSREDAGVRCAAAFHLRIIRDPRAFEPSLAVLRDRREPASVRAAAAEVLTGLGDARATELLTEVAQEEETGPVRFWAAIGAVRLREGAVDDVRIVEAIQNYSLDPDGLEMHKDTKEESLRSVAEHGSNGAVRAAARKAMTSTAANGPELPISQPGLLLLALLCVALVLLIILRRRSTKQAPVDSPLAGEVDQKTTANTGQLPSLPSADRAAADD